VGPTWDCTISGGSQRGLAFLTFEQGTFSGYLLLSAVPKGASTNPRTSFDDVGRSNETPSTNSVRGKTNLFGLTRIEGPWTYDERGRVIGHFTLDVESESGTDAAVLHPVSFMAKVVPGRRLTLTAYTPNGKVAYRGVPYRDIMPDVSGSWYATKKVKGVSYIDFFVLSHENPYVEAYPDLASYRGIYYIGEGEGPGYSLEGFALLSSRKKIGFVFEASELNYALDPESSEEVTTSLYATTGSFSSKRGVHKGSTAGVQEPYDKVTLKAVYQGPLVPSSASQY